MAERFRKPVLYPLSYEGVSAAYTREGLTRQRPPIPRLDGGRTRNEITGGLQRSTVVVRACDPCSGVPANDRVDSGREFDEEYGVSG
jgi:hypothetical protein